MHSIKKIGIRILLILVVLFVYENTIEFLYRSYNETIPLTNREREEVDGTVETLFCGTSTTQRGINPEIIDRELETVSFNLGSSMQPMDGTYELIKDMAGSNPVETVFLGISPDAMKKKKVNTVFRARVYDRLSGFGSKFSYLLEGCSLNEWPYMLLYSTRVDDYFDGSVVRKNVSKKLSEEYKNGDVSNKNYGGKGMISIKTIFDHEQIESLEIGKPKFVGTQVKEHNLEYLVKIVEYCEENQIELILLYVPLTGEKIQEYGDMATIHDYYSEFADKYDILFWDFNYYKDLKVLFTNDKFQDEKHLNSDGAEVFSEELAKVYYGYHTGQNIEEMFLDTCPYYLELEAVAENNE